MKKIIVFLSCCALTTCLFSCSKDEKSKNAENESSILEVMIPLEKPDVNIDIPKDYSETSTESNSTVYIKEDASIIINGDEFTDEYKNIDEYKEYAKKIFSEVSDEMEIKSEETISAGSINVRLLEYTYGINTNDGKFTKACMVAFFTDDEKPYIITCKSDVDTYESYRSEFVDIIKSISF